MPPVSIIIIIIIYVHPLAQSHRLKTNKRVITHS